ncbi:DNA cytosine methyltransferase [Bifidobacterium sp. SO1]|nr:DNA cytosine methyltransferase [Bifidobacterium sp. SO1]
MGYLLDADILDAQFFDVAQRRERVFVTGVRVDDLIGQRSVSSRIVVLQTLLTIGGGMLDFLYTDGMEEWPRPAVERRLKLFKLDNANALNDLLARSGIDETVDDKLAGRFWTLLQQMLNGHRFDEDETSTAVMQIVDYLLALTPMIRTVFTLTVDQSTPVKTMFEFERQLLTLLERFNQYARSKSQQPTLFDGDSLLFGDLMEQTMEDEKLVRHAIAQRWRAGQVLPERESMSWNNLQSRAKRQALARSVVESLTGSDQSVGVSGNLTPGESQGRRVYSIDGVNPTLQSRSEAGQNQQAVYQPDTYICQTAQTGSNGLGIAQSDVMNTLDTGNSTAVASLDFNPSDARLKYASDDLAQTLTARAGTGGNQVPLVQTEPVAFVQNQRNELREMDVAGALQAQPGIKQQTFINEVAAIIPDNAIGRPNSGTNGPMAYPGDDATPTLLSNGKTPAVACRSDGQSNASDDTELAPALTAHAKKEQPYIYPRESATTSNGDTVMPPLCATDGDKCFIDNQSIRSGRLVKETQATTDDRHQIKGLTIRRLTPVECERLQAFPDDYTNIPYRGKPSSPDGPRYKALGNSMCVNVMRWIGRQILTIEQEPSLTEKETNL